MQYKLTEYNEKLHDKYKALTVKQPYADYLVTPAYHDADNVVFGMKSIEVRSKNTSYRGDVLICSAANPVVPGRECGATLGFVELYDVKPVTEFTAADWEKTQIPEEKRNKLKGYGWLMRNPRKVVELPVTGQLGIYNLVYTKGEIMEYPRALVIDEETYNNCMREIKRKDKK